MAQGDSFTCATCKGNFIKARPSGEAIAEMKKDFPGSEKEPCGTVCDNCYHKIMAWFRSQSIH